MVPLALVLTLAVEVPIDNQIQDWTAATLPADWRSIQARWELFHTLRTFLSIGAVIAATVSATVARRPLDRAWGPAPFRTRPPPQASLTGIPRAGHGVPRSAAG